MRVTMKAPTMVAMLLAGLMLAAASHAWSTDLYVAGVIVTGRDDVAERRRGAEEALAVVLRRVSGDAALEVAVEDALSLAETIAYRDRKAGIQISDEQGTRDRSFVMTVRFEPAAVDRLLAEQGRVSWIDGRPAVAVRLMVDDGERAFEVTRTSTLGWGQRAALDDAAQAVGLDACLPEDQGFAEALVDLAGRMTVTPEGFWTTDWTLADDARRWTWTGPASTFDRAIEAGLWGVAERLRPQAQLR